ncbi:MAG: hypothetical protein AB7O04_10950 [Hyphomonadaceae bacterium]
MADTSDLSTSEEVIFPWVPGEALRLPDPAWTYRDDPAPPQHAMLTLTMLARGHTPQDEVPADWIAAIDEDALNSPIRAFARERFGLADVWNEGRQSYDWYDMEAKNPDGTAVAVPAKAALQRCWSGYAQLLLNELRRNRETPAQALMRIPDQWRQWTDARAAEFVEKWRDAAAWPPALALSWVMLEGNWGRIAAYLENGRDMPSAGIFLSCIGSFLEEDGAVPANRRAAQDLMHAFRLRADHSNRVIVRGRLNGQGPMVEIGPADLASLDWAMDPHHTLGAVLERYGGESYSNVLVDTASLVKAFPAEAEHSTDLPASTDTKALILEVAEAVVVPGVRASQRNDAIRKAFRERELVAPGDTTIKEALKGSRFIRGRNSRAN